MNVSWIEVFIDSISSLPIRLKIIKPNDISKGFVLHFHGFPGYPVIQDYDNIAENLFVKLGYTFITYNYPGLWDSPGVFSVENLTTSTLKIIETIFSSDNLSHKKLILFCESLGGLVGTNTVRENSNVVEKVILRSPVLDLDPILPFLPLTFDQLNKMGILRLSNEKFNFDDLSQYNPKVLLQNITNIPFWGVIGKNDEVLPGEIMIKAAEKIPNINLELWEDFPHNDISENLWKKYFASIELFLDK
ncbi:MAG: hypothetical protein HeimC3_03890 [Candidatus Heimdallarchaeota archaeon LC_3]|nr:MAG: hypothetical protein HeimC3_03890 [Candidatus Heimdallarchaeota archaeon LC_3]